MASALDESVIGGSTFARDCQDPREGDRRWCERRLDTHEVVDLFCHAPI